MGGELRDRRNRQPMNVQSKGSYSTSPDLFCHSTKSERLRRGTYNVSASYGID